MDATNDLLLGVFANVDMAWVEAYMVSSKQCGFRGRKILLVWNLHPTVRAKLVEYGFELEDVPQGIPGGDWHCFHKNFYEYRDKLAYEFLRDRGHEFRYVLWMDIRDLIFQSDPSVWMEKHLGDKKLVIATESYLIKNEACNDNWIREIFDAATYARIRECEALNGGTFAGTPEVLAEVFRRTYGIARGTEKIAEQAALNFIARESDFESFTLIPRLSEGFAAIGYCFGNRPKETWLDPEPDLRNGILYPQGGSEPFCIVHQYDRYWKWKFSVGDCYKIAPVLPQKKHLGGLRYAADGLTLNWFDYPHQ